MYISKYNNKIKKTEKKKKTAKTKKGKKRKTETKNCQTGGGEVGNFIYRC